MSLYAASGLEDHSILSVSMRIVANVRTNSPNSELNGLVAGLIEKILIERFSETVADIGSNVVEKAIDGDLAAINTIDELAAAEENDILIVLPTPAQEPNNNAITKLKNIVLSIERSTLQAGESLDGTIGYQDADGGPLSNLTGVITLHLDDNSYLSLEIASDEQGLQGFNLQPPTLARTYPIRATVGSLSSEEHTIVITPGPVAPNFSTTAYGGPVAADGVSAISVELTAKDDYGNPIIGLNRIPFASDPDLGLSAITCTAAEPVGNYLCSDAFTSNVSGDFAISLDPAGTIGTFEDFTISFLANELLGFSRGTHTYTSDPTITGIAPLTYNNISALTTMVSIDSTNYTSALPLLILDDGGLDSYAANGDHQIRVTNPSGNKLRLKMLSQTVESGNACTYDAIKIYDGASNAGALLGTHCGIDSFEYITSGPDVYITFTTDSSNQADGFALSISDFQERSYTSRVFDKGAIATLDAIRVIKTQDRRLDLNQRLLSSNYTGVGAERLELLLNFEGDSASTLLDSSGNTVNVTSADPPAREEAIFGKALLLLKDNTLPQIPDIVNTSNGLSISLWIKRADESISSTRKTLFSKWGDTDMEKEYRLMIDHDSVDMQVFTDTEDQISAHSIFTGHEGQSWIHFAFVYNHPSIKLYANGELLGQRDVSDPIQDTNSIIELGGYATGSIGYQGYIDELAIWSRPLSEGEVQELARRPIAKDVKIERWSCSQPDCSDNILGVNSKDVIEPELDSVSSDDQTYALIADTYKIARYAQYHLEFPDPSPIVPVRICESTQASAQKGILVDDGGRRGDYDRNLSCGFTITNPANTPLQLYALTFDMEGASCVFDYIEVFDGASDTDPLIGQYCGDNLPGLITSTGGQVYVKFTTDSGDERSGFTLYWEPVTPEPVEGFGRIEDIILNLQH